MDDVKDVAREVLLASWTGILTACFVGLFAHVGGVADVAQDVLLSR